MKKLVFLVVFSAACLTEFASAKDAPAQVIAWPDQGATVLRFTFGKFKEVGSLGSQRTYVTETTAENLWIRRILLVQRADAKNQ